MTVVATPAHFEQPTTILLQWSHGIEPWCKVLDEHIQVFFIHASMGPRHLTVV